MAGGVSPTRSKSVITDEIKVRKRFTDIALLFSITYVSECNREQSIIKVICDCVFEHGKHRSEHKQGENVSKRLHHRREPKHRYNRFYKRLYGLDVKKMCKACFTACGFFFVKRQIGTGGFF